MVVGAQGWTFMYPGEASDRIATRKSSFKSFALSNGGTIRLMEEWQKVLFGTGVGFLAGIITEPVKVLIGQKIKARRIEVGLISEIKNINDWFSLVIGDLPAKPDLLTSKLYEQLPKISFEVLDYYYESDRDIFYRIPLFGLYRNYAKAVRELAANPPRTPGEVASAYFVILVNTMMSTYRGRMRRWSRKIISQCCGDFTKANDKLKDYEKAQH